MKCCNKTLKLQTSEKGIKYYYCETCKRGGKGKTAKDAERDFNKSVTSKKQVQYDIVPVGKSEAINHLQVISHELANVNASYIDDKARRAIEQNNIEYIANQTSEKFNELWKTETGVKSIKKALADSFNYICELGKSGAIVPYGSKCEFIPEIECIEFALTNGRCAPFKEIFIIPYFENDVTQSWSENDGYHYRVEEGSPRGDFQGCFVGGFNIEHNKYEGRKYDEEFLIKVAEDHSPTYKAYLKEQFEFNVMRSEGKLDTDDFGKEYYNKKIEYKDKKTGKPKSFIKKIYAENADTPYIGTDRIKMLMKTAGKNYFNKFMKVRKATIVADEIDREENQSRDQAADFVLNQAGEQFADIVDGEIIEDIDSVENDDQPQKESNNGVANEDLFDQDSNDL